MIIPPVIPPAVKSTLAMKMNVTTTANIKYNSLRSTFFLTST